LKLDETKIAMAPPPPTPPSNPMDNQTHHLCIVMCMALCNQFFFLPFELVTQLIFLKKMPKFEKNYNISNNGVNLKRQKILLNDQCFSGGKNKNQPLVINLF
jgi:hypothetical protein